MKLFARLCSTALGVAMLPAVAVAAPETRSAPLPEETIPSVTPLPAQWPKSWVLINDLNFNGIVDGRVVVVDTASANQPLKAIVRSAQFGNSLYSAKRHEVLTAETFYSRLTRGERTDAITFWDMEAQGRDRAPRRQASAVGGLSAPVPVHQ